MSSFTRVGRWGGPDADTGVDILTAIDAERFEQREAVGRGWSGAGEELQCVAVRIGKAQRAAVVRIPHSAVRDSEPV